MRAYRLVLPLLLAGLQACGLPSLFFKSSDKPEPEAKRRPVFYEISVTDAEPTPARTSPVDEQPAEPAPKPIPEVAAAPAPLPSEPMPLPQGSLWEQLGRYRDTYLRAWRAALEEPRPDPIDVLDAFNELAYAVTGPRGFWRNLVPNRWFGCRNDQAAPVCQALAEAEPELEDWDHFQEHIALLPAGEAPRFLAHHRQRMLHYLAHYVPARPSPTEMMRTPFFRAHLAGLVDPPPHHRPAPPPVSKAP